MSAVVVIVSWEGAHVLPACLQAIALQLSTDTRLLVVDNASTDASVACVRHHCPEAQVIQNNANLGFGGGANVALRALMAGDTPKFVVLLNQDTVVAPDWLAGILGPFAQDDVGAVGCRLLYPDGKTIQHAGAHLEYPRALAHHVGWHELDLGQRDAQCDMDYVTGAALALRVTALRQVGIFDEGYNPGYYEDSDLCWRLRRAGFRIVYTGAARSVHQESTSIPDPLRRSMLYNRNRLRFVMKTYSSRQFWHDFVPAERVFIQQHGIGVEARALRWAYLHALIALPSTLAARSHIHPSDPLDPKEVGYLLMSLRRWIGDCLRARLAGQGGALSEA